MSSNPSPLLVRLTIDLTIGAADSAAAGRDAGAGGHDASAGASQLTATTVRQSVTELPAEDRASPTAAVGDTTGDDVGREAMPVDNLREAVEAEDIAAVDDATFLARVRRSLSAQRRRAISHASALERSGPTAIHSPGDAKPVDPAFADPSSVVSDPRFQKRARQLVRVADRRLSIIGGEPVTPGDLLDCVALWGNGIYGATGVLIAPNVILTAGHCLPFTEAIFFGENVTAGGESARVVRRELHPRYKAAPGDRNDMLVLVLDRTPAGVAPRPFANSTLIDEASLGRIAGFGTTDPSGGHDFGVKREVLVPIVSPQCDAQVGGQSDASRYGCEPGRELVAGKPNLGLDTCEGDSGGPLYIQDAQGRWRLAGITSRWTDRATRRCGDGAIYVRVDVYRDWIESVVGPLT